MFVNRNPCNFYISLTSSTTTRWLSALVCKRILSMVLRHFNNLHHSPVHTHTHTRSLTCSTDPPCPTLMELLWLSVSLRDTSIWNSGAWNQTLTHTRVNGDTFRYYDLNMTSDLEDFPSSSSSCCLCGEAGNSGGKKNCALSSFLTVQNTL